MPVVFTPGEELGRNDLKIFLVDELGVPCDAAEISYAIFFVDQSSGSPGIEVLIGASERTPVNPSIGEYYAALMVPPGASPGDYRVRWTFKKTLADEDQEVVQEFGVIDPASCATGQRLFSTCEAGLIDKLRIMLRDNCVGAEETVELDVNGERMVVRMDDLWEACGQHSGPPVDQRDKLRVAFREETLRVRSVSPQGEMEWKRVLAVHRAEVAPESIWEATTEEGPMVLTGGHRVFVSPTEKVEMERLTPGQKVLGVLEESVGEPALLSVKRVESRRFMYDLTAEDWHNFVLHRSKIVISNSPDRNYHFRPPEQEGTIKKYNRVFGYLWEDHELLCYLEMALDWFNSFPPETEGISTLNTLCQQKPAWRTFILWGAAVHALFALSINWVADEFSVAAETLVRVHLPDGRVCDLPISELHFICEGDAD